MKTFKFLFIVVVSLFFSKIVLTQQLLPIDSKNMDLSIKPGDDFFHYANGNWIKNNPIPPDKTRYGAFDELTENNLLQIKEIVESSMNDKTKPFGSTKQKIGDFYESGMDSVRIETLDIQPLLPYLERISKINNKEELIKELAYFHTYRIFPFFVTYGAQDDKNSTMVILHIGQGGLGLRDRDYYISEEPRMKEIRQKYIDFISKMFILIGNETAQAEKKAQTIMSLETKLAEISYSRYELREPEKNYHKIVSSELINICPYFDWMSYFNGLGFNDNSFEINVTQKPYFEKLGDVLSGIPLEDLKAYFEWNLIRSTSGYLSDKFIEAGFDFWGKFLSGQKEQKPRWKRVLETVNGSLGELLGQLYVEKYFPPQAKERIYNLVLNLKDAFYDRIQALSWMSDATKKSALAKLQSMNIKVGYPDKWRDYSGLQITKESFFENCMNANRFNYLYNLSQVGKPVDRQRWGMSPQTVNAYYSSNMNEIVFPAGILQPPFFFADGDDAVNYGGIGVVIGHEMTHGFDDQGRKYDKDGNLNDWWNETDAENYKKITSKLEEQFNNFYINDSLKVDGKLTLGENISDLGGITIALYALQKVWKKNPPPESIDGFTPLQRFFLSYAQIWRGDIRTKELMRRLKEDVHSPSIARVNGIVYNVPEFYKAFKIEPTDKLYKKPEERVSIW